VRIGAFIYNTANDSMARKFTDEQEKEIARKYLREDESTVKLAAAYGVSDSTIRSALERQGVTRRSISEALGGLTDKQEREIARRYLVEKENAVKLAAAYGVGSSTICRALDRQGVPRRSNSEAKGGLTDEQEKEVARRYLLEKESSEELATAYGVSSSAICRTLDRQGVTRRNRSEARRFFTDEQEKEIARRYLVEEENMPKLAAAYGVSDSTIYRALDRQGIPRRGNSEAQRIRHTSTTHILQPLLALKAQGIEAANLSQAELRIILHQSLRPQAITEAERELFDDLSRGEIIPRELIERLHPDDRRALAEQPAGRATLTVSATTVSATVDDHQATASPAPAPAAAPDGRTIADLLPVEAAVDQLDLLDAAASPAIGCDAEALEALQQIGLQRFWDQAYRSAAEAEAVALRCELHATDQPWTQRLQALFLEQYRAALTLPLPPAYRFRPAASPAIAPPTLMQRHVAATALHRRRLLLLSGMGTGKTLAAQLAVMAAGRRRVLVVALAETVEQWGDSFRADWGGVNATAGGWVPPTGDDVAVWVIATHLLSRMTDEQVVEIIERFGPDAVIADEIQFVKQRHASAQSKRRGQLEKLLYLATEAVPDLMVLGLSGTAVVNNLQEARKQIELITGERRDDLETEPSLSSAVAMHRALMANGIRQRSAARHPVTTITPSIDVSHLQEEVREALGTAKGPGTRLLAAEQALLPAKLPAILAAIDGPTVIATQYVDGFIAPIREAVEAAGYLVGVLTGKSRDPVHGYVDAIAAFKAGAIDVLLCSIGTTGTGVDGLQHRAHRLVIASLPWTDAAYQQLVARLDRTGQRRPVTVVIPSTVATYVDRDGELREWSLDQRRAGVLARKRRLVDAVMDGLLPSSDADLSPAEGNRYLGEWIDRLSADGAHLPQRRPVTVPIVFETAAAEMKARRRYGDWSTCNGRWGSMDSAALHRRLRIDPTEWELYHTDLERLRLAWPIDPLQEVIRHCAGLEGMLIADLGCGTNQLAEALRGRHAVHGFDHVAISEEVVACDVAGGIPVADGTYDLAVFCLSLMGTNWRDQLSAAWRILKPTGQMLVWSATGAHSLGTLKAAVERAGCRAIEALEHGKWAKVWAARAATAAWTTTEAR
jgi:transposase-like protein